jgi:CHAT domain-containing protein
MPPLNLVIEVATLPDGRYRIGFKSPVGEATADAPAPFTPQELADFRALFARQRDDITRQQEAAAARAFGSRLFDFLIRKHEQINAAYFASLDRAGGDGLRIRLSVDNAGELADLPWEFLRDPNREFLALSRQTPIVRYTPQLNARPALPVKLPLRVLVMISAPDGYPALDVEDEWKRLNEATAELQQKRMLILERLDTATLIALQRKLRLRDYHIFHYIGHSVYDTLAQQGLLVFEQEGDGKRAQLVSAGSLSREIGEEGTIRLVVLNSCQTAQHKSDDVFAGIASSLVARGVPAVVAMQYEITDPAAAAFAEEFYRAIAEGLPIDSAVSEGRRAIANRVQNLEWATPVLFMRAEDGMIFQTARTPETRPIGDRVRLPTADGAPTDSIGAAPTGSRPFPWAAAALVLTLLGFLIGLAIPLLTRGDTVVTPTPSMINTPTPVGALPDLLVTSMRVAPSRPAPGQIFRVSIGITNVGEATSGDFVYAWDASPRQTNAQFGEISSLPPGASRNFTLTFAYGWCGSYDSQVIIDDVGAVREVDERNNRRTLTIEVNPTAPFNIDFSLLPTLDFSEPGQPLLNDALIPWNMVISASADTLPQCIDAPIVFVQGEGDDMAVQAQPLDGTPDCATQPLSVSLRQPVGNALAEIIPASDGTATITLYNDLAGTQVEFSFDATLTAGQALTLGADVTSTRGIRRIDISASNQRVTLTRLVLEPVG